MEIAPIDPLIRKCNVCKHQLPWTREHFDFKHGRPEYGLCVICRRCTNRHFRHKEPAVELTERTTPNRLVYGPQPNHLDWCDWI